MTIEHLWLENTHPERSNDYENCVYACRYCNRSRYTSPRVDDRGRRLLDPTESAWADHFTPVGDVLECAPDDNDGCYTRDAYELNDELKVKLRARRAMLMQEWLASLQNDPPRIEALQRIAGKAGAHREEIQDIVSALLARMRTARRELAGYAAIPGDCDGACRCRSQEHHALPSWLEAQVREAPT
jgi:hypothetical protein